jgi:hypothetical protein
MRRYCENWRKRPCPGRRKFKKQNQGLHVLIEGSRVSSTCERSTGGSKNGTTAGIKPWGEKTSPQNG